MYVEAYDSATSVMIPISHKKAKTELKDIIAIIVNLFAHLGCEETINHLVATTNCCMSHLMGFCGDMCRLHHVPYA
jgi:hypothetical protein